MRTEVVDDLEAFMADGDLWDTAQLTGLVDRLGAESDPVTALLARPLSSLLVRQGLAPLAPRIRIDVEAIVWPRLWKVVEAVKAGLPDAEIRIRIEVLDRRLALRFATEPRTPAAPAAAV